MFEKKFSDTITFKYCSEERKASAVCDASGEFAQVKGDSLGVPGIHVENPGGGARKETAAALFAFFEECEANREPSVKAPEGYEWRKGSGPAWYLYPKANDRACTLLPWDEIEAGAYRVALKVFELNNEPELPDGMYWKRDHAYRDCWDLMRKEGSVGYTMDNGKKWQARELVTQDVDGGYLGGDFESLDLAKRALVEFARKL